ncbi:hypothetical protein JAAARDRAFT_202454 [Jaapia argillacea MUCL 33604]|uniref:Alpha/beta hydrolase fold-3 domain-containing protein n=1 Tax=Jaapia argillacea MUCL 33604 TaxID=933084 RepID=A0A067Q9V9_9AGAM|nr:hypothetical protein JAAARDRAFT_202454 [Jaapia argillacea MUCL 33604]
MLIIALVHFTKVPAISPFQKEPTSKAYGLTQSPPFSPQNLPIASPPLPHEKVVYTLHGGGYTALSAHPEDVAVDMAKGLLEHCKDVYRTFSIEYRLSVGAPFTPSNPFPAALLDALAGYNYLVNIVGFSFQHYFENQNNSEGIKLPAPPGSLLLSSPWGDLGNSHNIPGSSVTTCASSDYIGGLGFIYPQLALTGPHSLEATETNRYISPASRNPAMGKVSFKCFPKAFIAAGGAEVMLDSIRTLRNKMVEDIGEEGDTGVTYYEAEDAVHDYLGEACHEPERSETLAAIANVGPLTKSPNHLAIPEGANVKGVWVDPVSSLLTAELRSFASISSVEPARIPGYWLDKVGHDLPISSPPLPHEKVVYALHGGGYAALSAHPDDLTADIPKGLLRHSALLDALAGYNHLVNIVGFSPSNIIVEGDSAGGNLALALTRYLVENQNNSEGIKLPAPPSSLLLLSPWGDLGNSHNIPGSSVTACASSDYVGGSGFMYPVLAFIGPHSLEAAETNRYISPASRNPAMGKVSFKGFPKTFIAAGGAEVMLDSIRTLRNKMVDDIGEDRDGGVTYYEAEDAVHDYLGVAWHEPEKSETLAAIAKWV